MKIIGVLFTLFLFLSCSIPTTQSLEGVYIAKNQPDHKVWLMVDGYSSQIHYRDDAYISSEGGPFELKGNDLKVQKEFDDHKPDSVGNDRFYKLTFTKDGFEDQDGILWEKQQAIVQELDGGWKISGRMNEDKFVEINHVGSRKTIKLLVDGYFQWIAIEPDKKKFYGTGGGRYTFEKGAYTERILFFSRDNNRVGAELQFQGEIKDGDWHHTGNSSKGDPIYEVWTKIHNPARGFLID